jgi:XTP/dITP diphosphohydrolase
VPEVPPRRLVVATGNAGKMRELRALLGDLGFDLVAQTDLGIASVAETGATFADNALLKARHAAAAAATAGLRGAAVLADDSGLEVDALGGGPGVHSARYAGPGADDAANNRKLVAALAGLAPEARGARYRCVLVYLEGPEDPAPLVAEGVWEGRIATAPCGAGGFGYDPYFFVPGAQCTAAELPPATKNRLSHRAIALAELRRTLLARGSA